MRAVRFAPRMAVLLGLLTATGVTGCSAHGPVAATASPPASSTAAASAAAVATGTASAPAVTSSATSSATPSASGAVQNLLVSAAVRGELLADYAAYRKIPAADVQGVPGSVYYAYQPSAGTYWAMASYEPASGDSLSVEVGFQDGGGDGLYKRTGNGAWQVSQGSAPEICTELKFFPQQVLAAWSLPTSATPASMC